MRKGTRVVVTGGQDEGVTGVVFWSGPSKYGDGTRLGIKTDEGVTHWVNATDAQKVVESELEVDADGNVQIDCRVRVAHRTGVEMEALTGASIAALTVYDMCKALSHDIVIDDLRLIEKTGGKSDWRSADGPDAARG